MQTHLAQARPVPTFTALGPRAFPGHARSHHRFSLTGEMSRSSAESSAPGRFPSADGLVLARRRKTAPRVRLAVPGRPLPGELFRNLNDVSMADSAKVARRATSAGEEEPRRPFGTKGLCPATVRQLTDRPVEPQRKAEARTAKTAKARQRRRRTAKPSGPLGEGRRKASPGFTAKATRPTRFARAANHERLFADNGLVEPLLACWRLIPRAAPSQGLPPGRGQNPRRGPGRREPVLGRAFDSAGLGSLFRIPNLGCLILQRQSTPEGGTAWAMPKVCAAHQKASASGSSVSRSPWQCQGGPPTRGAQGYL